MEESKDEGGVVKEGRKRRWRWKRESENWKTETIGIVDLPHLRVPENLVRIPQSQERLSCLVAVVRVLRRLLPGLLFVGVGLQDAALVSLGDTSLIKPEKRATEAFQVGRKILGDSVLLCSGPPPLRCFL